MTDNDIKKALECCITNDCAKCKAYDETNGEIVDCLHAICRNALDLINRQQADKEAMQEYIDCLRAEIEMLKDDFESKVLIQVEANCRYKEKELSLLKDIQNRVKSEAIKEFAELVKMEFYKEFDELIPSIMADKIDNLVKEMTEVSE